MAKMPEKYRPFDPAKAARERNKQEPAAPPAMTLQQRLAAKRTYLRPQPPGLRDKD